MSKEVKVAIFTIFMILVFIFGLNYLKGKGFLSKNVHYYAVLENLSGLQVSNPVLVNGFKVGIVSDLDFMYDGPHKGKIMGRITLNDDIKIPQESTAILYSTGFMGEMSVKIIVSDENAFHESGDTINTKIEADLLSELGGEITPITEKLNDLLNNLNMLFDFEKTNPQSLNYTIASINKSLTSFEEISGSLNNNLDKQFSNLDKVMNNLETTTQMLADNEENLNAIIGNAKNITETLSNGELEKMIAELATTSEEAKKLMSKLNSSDNTVGALLNEKELYNEIESKIASLDGVILNANLLLEDMRLNPQRYIHFSVFGKKDKSKD